MFTIKNIDGEVVSFSNIIDLGNPSKVKLCRGTGVTYGEMLEIAKSFFSVENIHNNANIFSNIAHENGGFGDFNRTFLEKIPADLVPYSFFLTLFELDGRGSITDYRGMVHWHSSRNQLAYSDQPSTRVALDSENYWNGLKLYLTQIQEFFTGTVWGLMKDVKSDQNSYITSAAFSWAQKQMYGQRYIFRLTTPTQQINIYGGTATITAADLLEMVSANSNTNISIEYRDRDQRWVVVAPISVTNRSSLYQVFPASQNVLEILGQPSPKKKIYKKEGKEATYVAEKDNKLFGVELELCSSLTVRQMIDHQKSIFFLCKADSSIRGSKPHGYECVTGPMTLADHRKHWSQWFHSISDLSTFDTTTQTGNGMHVHISKGLFKTKTKKGEYCHLSNFAWFMTNPCHAEFILALSQRTADNFQQWCPLPAYSERNEFEAWKKAITRNSTGNRGACNIRSRSGSTVEIRMFKGVVSCAEVIRNLEVVDSFYEFTRVTPWYQLTLSNYYKWVKDTPRSQYKLLRADLYKLDMDKMIRRAEVSRLVFGMNDANKIVEKINETKKKTEKQKQPFVVDDFVLATLHRLIGKRCFGLDDDGALTLIHKNVGRLAHLDSKLIAAYNR